jgi:NAD(P)-dependent dehydrogenase (short-subunit alcohol dehydrogenase family)
VYITSRSSARGDKTRNALVESLGTNPDSIQSLQLDFSDLKSVDAAAAKLIGKESKLDLLSMLLLLLLVRAGND